MADAAVEAAVSLAIAAPQLDEGLGGEGVAGLDAGGGKACDDAVALGRELLEPFKGALRHRLITLAFAVGYEQGDGDVDNQNYGRVTAHGDVGALAVDRRGRECVMLCPIAREGCAEQCDGLLGRRGIKQPAHDAEVAGNIGGECGYAAVREVGGAHTSHLPAGGCERAE